MCSLDRHGSFFGHGNLLCRRVLRLKRGKQRQLSLTRLRCCLEIMVPLKAQLADLLLHGALDI